MVLVLPPFHGLFKLEATAASNTSNNQPVSFPHRPLRRLHDCYLLKTTWQQSICLSRFHPYIFRIASALAVSPSFAFVELRAVSQCVTNEYADILHFDSEKQCDDTSGLNFFYIRFFVRMLLDFATLIFSRHLNDTDVAGEFEDMRKT